MVPLLCLHLLAGTFYVFCWWRPVSVIRCHLKVPITVGSAAPVPPDTRFCCGPIGDVRITTPCGIVRSIVGSALASTITLVGVEEALRDIRRQRALFVAVEWLDGWLTGRVVAGGGRVIVQRNPPPGWMVGWFARGDC